MMNPRTHPVGARPDFGLPRPNPNPSRMTDALWWLVCMREALEPGLSENGGTFADKAGSHNIGANLPDHGEGNIRTDHSIRHAWNRSGPWWKTKCAAHDWTFLDAQRGDYRTINRYTRRLINAMKDPADTRPDKVVFYTLGNIDGGVTTEGWNELKNGPEYSGDNTHAWHRHDSFFRNVVGDFWAMWAVLTIDMGWTYQQWQQSLEEDDMTKEQFFSWMTEWVKSGTGRDALARALLTADGIIPGPPGSTNADGTPNQFWSAASYLQWGYRASVDAKAFSDAAVKGIAEVRSAISAGQPQVSEETLTRALVAALRELAAPPA